MRTRHVAVAGLAAVLLAACGGGSGSGNGEADKKGPQVAKDAAAALDKAGSAHVTATLASAGQREKVDLDMRGTDTSGTVTIGAQAVKIISTGGNLYLQAPAEFFTAQGLSAEQAGQLVGKWVTLPKQSGGGLGDFNLKSLSGELRKPSSGTTKNAVKTATVNGTKVVVVTESDGSTVDVAAEGAAYPLRFQNKSSDNSGTITLSDFGKKFAIAAPPSPVPLPSLTGG
jgi:hypothetical protein